MDALNSKEESDVYFERIAGEFEEIAGAVRLLRARDAKLAKRLAALARQIRTDSGLNVPGNPR